MQRRAVERVKGIEPSSLGWEPRALPLSYTRRECGFYAAPSERGNELSYGQPAQILPARSTAMRFFIPLFALALAAPLAFADESMRCGRWIIDSEVTVEDLVAKCGEPAEQADRHHRGQAPECQWSRHPAGRHHHDGTVALRSRLELIQDGRHDRGWRGQEHR